MKTTNWRQAIFESLKGDSRLWLKKEGREAELDKIRLLSLLDKNDPKLIEVLFNNDIAKSKFFVRVGEHYVFKRDEFRFFIEETKINNSYTDFRNKIGLTVSKKFISEGSDVVLDFPYKDCVLQGCQDKEDANRKNRQEVFLNQVIAHEEIDRLFEPKALVNWKRYDKEGESEL